MKPPRLPALEKNVLKYRALQMVLVLHKFESLKRFIIESIRATAKMYEAPLVPPGSKKPFETALDVLVSEGIIEQHEKLNLLEFGLFRNRIGHEIHRLVEDVTTPERYYKKACLHDYWAITHMERLSTKIWKGMGDKFILSCSLDDVIFEQAELTYKEELARLDRKIQRQVAARLADREPNNSLKAAGFAAV